MKKLREKFLKNFDLNDQELRLKAIFLLSITIVINLGLILTLIYTCYTFGIHSFTVLVQSLGLSIMLATLLFLIKGHYTVSVHILFITAFSVAWILMFTEPVSSLLIKLDTIVFIIGLMSALPLMFFSTRKPMIAYFIFNFGIFIFFNLYLYQVANLSTREHLDYAFDNTITMTFVFAVSYILFTISQKVLGSLKQVRLLLSSIIDSMPSIIIGINEQYQIVMWNKQAVKSTKLPKEKASNINLFDALPQLQSHKDLITGVMETSKTSIIHKTKFFYNKRERLVDIEISPLFHEESGGVVIRIDDISDRLKMEEMVVQSEKMISIGGLAAGMAHELNNPLAGMIQNAQVINNRLTQNLSANDLAAAEVGSSMNDIKKFMEKRGILKQLENIILAGDRAAKIVDNMLSFSRKSDFFLEDIELNDLIDKAVELAENDYDLKEKNDFKHIEIIKAYDPELALTIKGEKSKIHQVLFNMLKNSSEAFTIEEKDGSQPRIILNLYADSKYVCIEIEDNGPGMDDETKRRIFEPFFTTKPVGKGTGLGLSVSYFIIVENHGGKMEVESIKGKGTKFTICLPKEKP